MVPYVQLEDVPLYFEERGEGIPILFVHPPILSGRNFELQLAGLTPRIRAIAFDIRGHGNTPPGQKRLTYDLIVRDMLQLMDMLGIAKTYVCGYSIGGSVALNFLLSSPERALGGILVGGYSEILDPFLRGLTRAVSQLTKSRWGKRLLDDQIARGNAVNKEQYLRLRRENRKSHPERVREYYEASLSFNCTSQLGEVKLPVLLVNGKKDRFFQRYSRVLEKGLPQAETFLVEGVHHQVPTRGALQFNRRIRQFVFAHLDRSAERTEGELLLPGQAPQSASFEDKETGKFFNFE